MGSSASLSPALSLLRRLRDEERRDRDDAGDEQLELAGLVGRLRRADRALVLELARRLAKRRPR
jgi:hypothetical protein